MLKVASGPGMGLAGCGDALNPSVVCSTGCSGAVIPVLVLLFVVVCFAGRFVLGLALCYFVFVFFSPFGVAIASFGEEGVCAEGGLVLVPFVHLFDLRLFGFVGFLFLLVSERGGVGGRGGGTGVELRLLVVALPGLFSCLF